MRGNVKRGDFQLSIQGIVLEINSRLDEMKDIEGRREEERKGMRENEREIRGE